MTCANLWCDERWENPLKLSIGGGWTYSKETIMRKPDQKERYKSRRTEAAVFLGLKKLEDELAAKTPKLVLPIWIDCDWLELAREKE